MQHENVDRDDWLNYISRTESNSAPFGETTVRPAAPPVSENSIDRIFGNISISENASPRTLTGFENATQTVSRTETSSTAGYGAISQRFDAGSDRSRTNLEHTSLEDPFGSARGQSTATATAPGAGLTDVWQASNPSGPQGPGLGLGRPPSIKKKPLPPTASVHTRTPSIISNQSTSPRPFQQFEDVLSPTLPNDSPSQTQPATPQSTPSPWWVTPEALAEYDSLFRKWGSFGSSHITGSDAIILFASFDIPEGILGEMWQIADEKNLGYLSRRDFVLMMHFTRLYKAHLWPEVDKDSAYIQKLRFQISVLLENPTKTSFPVPQPKSPFGSPFSSPGRVAVEPPVSANAPSARASSTPKYGSVQISTRTAYEFTSIERLLPGIETLVQESRQNEAKMKPATESDIFSDPLDSFNDDDISDDEEMITHRITFHYSGLIEAVKLRNWNETLAKLDVCGYPPNDFRIQVIKGILNNYLNRPEEAKRSLNMSYSAPHGVHANLQLYYNRALALYKEGLNTGDTSQALNDCKRGQKLIRMLNSPLPPDSLEEWVASDIFELAATISSENNRADALFYKQRIRANHPTHPLLAGPEGSLVSEQLGDGAKFLEARGIRVRRESPNGRSPEASYIIAIDQPEGQTGQNKSNSTAYQSTIYFAAFRDALAENNFAAAKILMIAEGNWSIQANEWQVSLPDEKRERIQGHPQLFYPYTVLHFIAAYPEARFGPSLIADPIRRGLDPDTSIPHRDGRKQVIDAPNNYTALNLAVVFNNMPAIKILVSNGAKYEFSRIHAFPSPILTAAYLAPLIGSLLPLEYLMTLRPEIDGTDAHHLSIFHHMVYPSNISMTYGDRVNEATALRLLLGAVKLLLGADRVNLSHLGSRALPGTPLDLAAKRVADKTSTQGIREHYTQILQLFKSAKGA